MINSIKAQNLRNSEFIQYIADVLGIVGLNNPQTLLVQNEYDNLVTAKSSLDALFKKEQGSLMTDELVALDDLRDNLINGVIAIIQGHTYNTDATLKGKANALHANLSIYGAGIARENYQSETAIITNIINDWTAQPALADALTALGLDSWKTQLVSANTSFNAKYLERTQEFGAASPDNLKAKRLEAANAYYTLRDYINSYFVINKGVPPFDKVTNELNALIDQYNKMLASRKGSGPTPPETIDTPKA